jgi:hypothetical protein
MYIPVDPVGGGGDVIPGNLQVGGNLAVDGLLTVDGAVNFGSTLGVTGPASMSDLTATGNIILSTNPAANGVSIGTNVLPTGVGGLKVAGLTTLATANITALGLGSFGATNPPVSIATAPAQYVLGVFSGWRVVFGWNTQGGADSTVTFGTAYTGLPIVLASVSDQGTAGDSQIVRLSNITRANFNIHAEALNQTGGGGLAVSWIAIGQA